RTIRRESVVPQPRSPTQTHVADKAASTGMDVRYGGAATTVTSLEVRQGSGNIDKTPTMPQDSPLPRVNTLGSNKGSLTLQELMILCTTLSKKMESLETDLKHTKLTYVAAYTKLIKKVKKIENNTAKAKLRKKKAELPEYKEALASFNIEEWEDVQARVEADEELAQRLQAKEREKYSEAKKQDCLSRILLNNNEDVHTFVRMDVRVERAILESTAGNSKRDAEEELAQESSKRQKTRESSVSAEEPKDKEEELSQERLQQMMIIVPEQGMNDARSTGRSSSWEFILRVYQISLMIMLKAFLIWEDLVKLDSSCKKEVNSTETNQGQRKPEYRLNVEDSCLTIFK
ncbi:hypothetical protein Tco_0873255, partial [Tanacetum coccineum]